MQASIKHKFVFLCNPKCGSTAVEKAIRKYCEVRLNGHPSIKHIRAARFNRHIRPVLEKADPKNQIETFCIMREPLERLKSWYTYRSRPQIEDPKHRSHKHYTGNLSYAEFIEGYMAGNRPEAGGIGSQASFVTLTDGSIAVDHIFRLDQMDRVADFLSRKIGQTIRIPVANKSPEGTSGSKSRNLDLPAELMDRLMTFLEPEYAIYKDLPWSRATAKR